MPKEFNRRSFFNKSILSGAAAMGLTGLEQKTLLAGMEKDNDVNNAKQENKAGTKIPFGKLGNLKISRLISGGNLLSGWCHQRDLLYVARLAKAYLTQKKQFDTLELLEESGVNSIVIDMMQLEITNMYRNERGGEMKTIVGVREDWGRWDNANWARLKTEIDKSIDSGADTLFMHGGYCDRLVEAGKHRNVELLGKAIEYIRQQGYAAGLGSHSIYVPIECDKLQIIPDYYFKTFHHDKYWSATPKEKRRKFCVDGELHLDHNEFHDNIFCLEPEKTAEYMKNKKQPWIAYKVLAAGAIHPMDGFKYAFENGADFICVGMFDFEVVEDTVIARDVLKELKNRQRPWRA